MASTRSTLPRAAKAKVTSYLIPGDSHKVRKPKPKPKPAAGAAAGRRNALAPAPIIHPAPVAPPYQRHWDDGFDDNTCRICANDLSTSAVPEQREIPAHCWVHIDQRVCRQCVLRSLRYDLFSVHGAGCPICGIDWELQDLFHLLTTEQLGVLGTRMTNQALERDEAFRWCAGEKCVNGQMYDLDVVKESPKVCCKECEGVNCFDCRVVWHEGRSCNEFRKGIEGGQGADGMVKAMRENHTRLCPRCHVGVEKTYGCDSMMCSNCSHLFLWTTAQLV